MMNYNFPATIWTETETPVEQFSKVGDEFDEAAEAEIDSKEELREMFDLLQAIETWFRIQERLGVDIEAARKEHIQYLTERGYYLKGENK